MNKLNVAYQHNEILFGNKKEWGTNTGYSTDRSWKNAKLKTPVTKNALHIYWS